MKLIIPKQPEVLCLKVDHLWNGDACSDERIFASFDISSTADGLLIQAESPILDDQKISKDVPIGSRVEDLWNYDVVELFLVGPGHQYIEIELGAGGHFLVLSFDSIRHRSNEHKNFQPNLRFKKTKDKTWISEILIPWKMIPENLRALNVFMIAGGQFLSYSPLPGDKPDFHQPDYYQAVGF